LSYRQQAFGKAQEMRSENTLIFGDVVTPETILIGGWLLVEGARIAGLGRKKPPTANARVIRCGGNFVCPGFIDVHVQGSMGYDVWQRDRDAAGNVSKALARFGTTGFLATTHFDGGVVKRIREAKRKGVEGARILGIHLETPFVSLKMRGAIEKRDIRRPSMAYLKNVLSVCGKDLKLMTIAPELPGAQNIIKELLRNKVIVSVGHTDANYEEALAAVRAGATQATHVFNAMRGFAHREPGTSGCLLTEDGVALQVIADGVHLHKAAIRLIYRAKNIDDILLITDAVAPAGLKHAKGLKVHDRLSVYVRDGAVRLKDGTLAGSALTMNRAIRNFMEFTGASVVEAVRCASLNPARSIRMDRSIGSLQKGKFANIAVLDRKFNVTKTFIRGKLVYNG
jgi:N-acetylglucosamine-6-phosphate deacetylase